MQTITASVRDEDVKEIEKVMKEKKWSRSQTVRELLAVAFKKGVK